MHGNLTITDGIDGVLSETDVREQIARLGLMADLGKANQLIPLLAQLLSQLTAKKVG